MMPCVTVTWQFELASRRGRQANELTNKAGLLYIYTCHIYVLNKASNIISMTVPLSTDVLDISIYIFDRSSNIIYKTNQLDHFDAISFVIF